MEGVSQDAILQDEETDERNLQTVGKVENGIRHKILSRRFEEKKGNMIFSEESRRAIYEMGNLELIELGQNLGDKSVSFLPEPRTRGIEHVSMCRPASTQ